jgi:putative flippase GtrA
VQRVCLRLLFRWRTVKKGSKFAVVGFIGYFEGLGLFWVFTRMMGIYDLWALTLSTLVVAWSNFLGNILNGNIKLEDSAEAQ